MSPADRFRDWIDGLSAAWKDRLSGWMVSWATRSITDSLEDMSPEQQAALDTVSKRIMDNPDIPTDLKDMLEAAGKRGNPIQTFVKNVIFGYWLIEIVARMVAPEGTKIGYVRQREFEPFRLDPMSVIIAWRRDPEKYAKYFDDLKDQGWNDERIEALKFFTQFMPSAQDLVNWEAKEVFEPAMIAKYGLDDEFGGLDLTLFAKIGVTKEQALNYWRAHWEHASWNQVVEMVRRGQMTEADVWDWFRLVEIPPFWRDKLIAISWEVPTRVDVRRFYDMKTIDEVRLREIYTAQGYHGKDLEDYVLWTKIYVELPDLLARWKNGWITLEEVRSRLIEDGMDPGAADELIQTKVKSVEPTSTAEGKELTKTEIYKGVKQGILSDSEGLDLLMDLDYTRDQADYLLTTNVAILTGSPEMYIDFKDMTQKYRKAVGLESQAVTEELKRAAAEVVRLTKDVAALKEAVETEQRGLVAGKILPEKATEKLDELKVTRNRAEAELSAAQTNYNVLIAQWRHGE